MRAEIYSSLLEAGQREGGSVRMAVVEWEGLSRGAGLPCASGSDTLGGG